MKNKFIAVLAFVLATFFSSHSLAHVPDMAATKAAQVRDSLCVMSAVYASPSVFNPDLIAYRCVSFEQGAGQEYMKAREELVTSSTAEADRAALVLATLRKGASLFALFVKTRCIRKGLSQSACERVLITNPGS